MCGGGDHGGPGDQVSSATHFVEQGEGDVPIAAFGVEGEEGVSGNGVGGEARGEEAAVDAAADGEVAAAGAGVEEGGVGDEVGGAAEEVEGGEGVGEAAGVGEAEEAALERGVGRR